MEKYTFEQLWKELNEGYQIYYIYMNKKYLLTKLKSNCYSRELVESSGKEPLPRTQMVTLKSVKEIFPYMEDIQYKI